MRRREFITLLGGGGGVAAGGARAAAGDAGDRFSQQRDRLSRPRHIVAGFRQGLNEAGYVEGRNVAIEYRWAEGQYDRLPALAADLVRRQVGRDRHDRRPLDAARGQGGDLDNSRSSSHSASTPWSLASSASLNGPGGNVQG